MNSVVYKFIAVKLCVFFFASIAFSQTQSPITLLVIDADADHTPIIGAMVSSTFFNGITNTMGELTLNSYPRNGFHVHVRAEMYSPTEQHIYIKPEEKIYQIELHRAQDTLHTVSVTGYTYSGDNKISVTNIISQEALNTTKGSDLAEVLQQIPGVTMLQTGATISKPIINGLHSNRIAILNNGVKQEGQQWGAEHAPDIDPTAAGNIVVIKGADAVRYGAEALGGVILINPPALLYGDAFHADAYLLGMSNGGLFGGGVSLKSSFKNHPKWAWRAQASGKKSGNYKTADYFLNNTGVNELGVSAEAGYKNDRWEIKLYASNFNKETGTFIGSHIGDTSDLFLRIRNGRPFEEGNFSYQIDAPRQTANHQLYKLSSNIDLKSNGDVHLQYAFQNNSRKEYDLRRAGRSAVPSLDLVLQTHSAEAYWKYNPRNDWRSQLGIVGEYQSNYSLPGTGVTPLIPNYKKMGLGFYTIQNYIQPHYELEAGARYDVQYLNAKGVRNFYEYTDSSQLPVLVKNYYGGENTYQNVSGILGATWKPNSQWRITTNVGAAWRPPQVSELYSEGLHHGTASIELGDSTLTSEKALKWIIGITYKSSWLNIDLNGYVQYIKDYIYLLPTIEFQQTIRGAFPVFHYAQTNVRYSGFDISGKLKINKHFDYLLKSAMVLAKDVKNNTYLPMIPPFQISNAVKLKAESLGSLRDNYLMIECAYTSRQNRYAPQSDFAEPPAAYSLWNAELNTRVAAFQINLKADNLFNIQYKDYLDRFRYYNHSMGRNIQLRVIYQF